MKNKVLNLFVAFIVSSAATAYADATVRLNNYDSTSPIYFFDNKTLAFGSDIHVEAFATTTDGGTWVPVYIAGTTTSVLSLKEPGYLDAGLELYLAHNGV